MAAREHRLISAPHRARKPLAAVAVALAFAVSPAAALAQDAPPPGSSVFGPVGPAGPVTADAEPEAQQQPLPPQPQPPVPRAKDQMLGTPELLVFVTIQVLLLGALCVAIAREGGRTGAGSRRGRHAPRPRAPGRKRGATHDRVSAKAPPPPPRRRRAKAARRAKAGRR